MNYNNDLGSEDSNQKLKTLTPTISSCVLWHDTASGEVQDTDLAANDTDLVADDSNLNERQSPARLHAQMYITGDKYDIPGLRNLARQKFESVIVVDWEQATFISIIDLIYGADGFGDGGLRKTICEVALQNLESLSTLPAFDLILQATPSFAYEFAQVMMVKLNSMKGSYSLYP